MKTKRQRQCMPSSRTSSKMQKPDTGDGTSTIIIDSAQYFEHFFDIGQALCGQTSGVADRIAQEVACITQGHAQLHLNFPNVETSYSSSSVSFTFPVQFRDRVYGLLLVASDPSKPTYPLLPYADAHRLAQICGWLLYTLEVSIFIKGKHQEFIQNTNKPLKLLTRRHLDVLTLMAHGYNDEVIAKILTITVATVKKHRQHIYERLEVHSEQDALLIAYQHRLFSPLQDISC